MTQCSKIAPNCKFSCHILHDSTNSYRNCGSWLTSDNHRLQFWLINWIKEEEGPLSCVLTNAEWLMGGTRVNRTRLIRWLIPTFSATFSIEWPSERFGRSIGSLNHIESLFIQLTNRRRLRPTEWRWSLTDDVTVWWRHGLVRVDHVLLFLLLRERRGKIMQRRDELQQQLHHSDFHSK